MLFLPELRDGFLRLELLLPASSSPLDGLDETEPYVAPTPKKLSGMC
jgi:hypothetical protein